jgi:hypothetical protein
MVEVGQALIDGEERQGGRDQLTDRIEGARPSGAEERFELERREIGVVLRSCALPIPSPFDIQIHAC